MSETFEFSTEIEIDASPELVFQFFTQDELLERWQCLHAETDPRPGGKFVWNITGKDITRGEFLEVDVNKRLVFSWGFQEAGATTVEVTLTAKGRGTLLQLRHTRFDSAASRDGHRDGWADYLKRLAIAATGEDPGPDPRRG